MDSLRRLAITCSLLIGSAVASFLFVSGMNLSMPVPVKWVLYFPFYGTLVISSVIWHLIGIRVLNPILFLTGVVLSAVYVVFVLEKLPKNIKYKGTGILFFVFLLICGRSAFVQAIYVPHATSVGTVVHSIKVFLEFLMVLILLYMVLREVGSTSSGTCEEEQPI
ncbi:MAG: hypothetical protein HXS44_14985 [Theionarchaea archaeon]|nr:hypothetical protein [Theionarchaea archaeon]